MNLDFDPKQALYDFDLNGFFTVEEDVIDAALRERLLQAWQVRAPETEAFDICFGWGEPWTILLSEGVSKLDGLLTVILGRRYKLDHAFCVSEKFFSSKDRLHHHRHANAVRQSDFFHHEGKEGYEGRKAGSFRTVLWTRILHDLRVLRG